MAAVRFRLGREQEITVCMSGDVRPNSAQNGPKFLDSGWAHARMLNSLTHSLILSFSPARRGTARGCYCRCGSRYTCSLSVFISLVTCRHICVHYIIHYIFRYIPGSEYEYEKMSAPYRDFISPHLTSPHSTLLVCSLNCGRGDRCGENEMHISFTSIAYRNRPHTTTIATTNNKSIPLITKGTPIESKVESGAKGDQRLFRNSFREEDAAILEKERQNSRSRKRSLHSREGTDVEVENLSDEQQPSKEQQTGPPARAKHLIQGPRVMNVHAAAASVDTSIDIDPKLTCPYGHKLKAYRDLDEEARKHIPNECSRCGLALDKKENKFLFCEITHYALGAFGQHDILEKIPPPATAG